MKFPRPQVFVAGQWIEADQTDGPYARKYPSPPLSEAEQVLANARADKFEQDCRRRDRLQVRIGWGVILTVFVIALSRCIG